MQLTTRTTLITCCSLFDSELDYIYHYCALQVPEKSVESDDEVNINLENKRMKRVDHTNVLLSTIDFPSLTIVTEYVKYPAQKVP